jgi:hypothetical protein
MSPTCSAAAAGTDKNWSIIKPSKSAMVPGAALISAASMINIDAVAFDVGQQTEA